jgi:hypothetical protein
MAAGLGFKNFASGEVLTAADVNGYLNSQTVMVFADAAARTAAITSPQEGMFSYLKDTNATQYYTGSAWTNLDTTGMVNPMTTTGDTIYSSSGTTPARLGIGTTGQVLTVAGGLPSWATPAASASGLTKLVATTFSGVSSYSAPNGTFSATYNQYVILIEVTSQTANADNRMRLRVSGTDATASDYRTQRLGATGSTVNGDGFTDAHWSFGASNTNTRFFCKIDISDPFSTGQHLHVSEVFRLDNTSSFYRDAVGGRFDVATAYDSFTFYPSSGTITGRVAVYGYAL